ncbi:MAG TPA: NUDIX domain-containing protein [Myxococcota bacterium]|nr:NUDIX domain-containing protein [Myxococcota bacterium]
MYAKLAWWGLAAPRVVERTPLVVVQGIVRSERGELLLAARSDLRGWELPGGTPERGEALEDALRRELHEETGLHVSVERVVGDYVRSGFRPHTARVYLCQAAGGRLRPSHETLALRWFDPEALPDTLFPWYRAPIADAFGAPSAPVTRHEHHGLSSIFAGLAIDLKTRVRGIEGEANVQGRREIRD